MSIKTRIDKIEAFFGYPLPSPIRARIKAEITGDPDTPAKQTDAFFVGGVIDWEGEHWEGPNPSHEHLRAMFDGEIPPAQLRPTKPARMALHFTGLLQLDTDLKHGSDGLIEDAAYWVADLNPRQDDIKTCPVYHYLPGESLGPYLVESPERLDAWRSAINEIESLDAKIEAKKKPPLVKALLGNFPWQVVARQDDLIQRRILGKKDPVPKVAPPADPEAQRLDQALRSWLPIAEVLSARAHDKVKGKTATLSAASAKKALAFADKNPGWPPSQALRLQALALGGDLQSAQAEAKRLLGRQETSPLARRWAERVIAKRSPYDR